MDLLHILIGIAGIVGFILMIGVPFAFVGGMFGMALGSGLKNEKHQRMVAFTCAVLFFASIVWYFADIMLMG